MINFDINKRFPNKNYIIKYNALICYKRINKNSWSKTNFTKLNISGPASQK